MSRGTDSGRLAEGLPAVDLPAAAVAVAMVRLTQPDPPRIGSVRLGELTARFALDVAGDSSSEEAASAEARRWAAALEQALRAVAERHDAVLLPARAVAAGALDLTADVELTLLRLLQEPEAEVVAAPAGTQP